MLNFIRNDKLYKFHTNITKCQNGKLNFYLYNLFFSLLHKDLNLKRQKISVLIDKFRSVVT